MQKVEIRVFSNLSFLIGQIIITVSEEVSEFSQILYLHVISTNLSRGM